MVTDKILDPTTDEGVDVVKTLHFSKASEIDSDDNLDTCELSKARCMVSNTWHTFKGVLINNQDTTSFHLIAESDAVSSSSSAGATGGCAWHASWYAGSYALSHSACTGVEGLGGICCGIQNFNTHRDHAKCLGGFLIGNTPDKRKNTTNVRLVTCGN